MNVEDIIHPVGMKEKLLRLPDDDGTCSPPAVVVAENGGKFCDVWILEVDISGPDGPDGPGWPVEKLAPLAEVTLFSLLLGAVTRPETVGRLITEVVVSLREGKVDDKSNIDPI